MSDSESYRHRRIGWGNRNSFARAAISEFQLYQLGWRGFEALDWVRELAQRYPEMIELSRSVSALRPDFLELPRRLFESADPADRPGILNFFIGKVGLEEISCRRNGAGASLCDKLRAFDEICELFIEIMEREVKQ